MEELEKMREEFKRADSEREIAVEEFVNRMNYALECFKATLRYAREIERQAGIGEEK